MFPFASLGMAIAEGYSSSNSLARDAITGETFGSKIFRLELIIPIHLVKLAG